MSEGKHRPKPKPAPPNPGPSSGTWFFSPPGCAPGVINALNAAQKSVDIAMYSFTNAEIAQAILSVQSRGVPLRIVFDQTETKDTQAQFYDQFEQAGIPIKVYSPPGAIMHNKFAVIDLATVINGSFNWTEAAEHKNYENLQIHVDPTMAAAYETMFETIWGLAQPEPSSATDREAARLQRMTLPRHPF